MTSERGQFAGVDPGLSGAMAVLDSAGGVLALEDLPIIRDGKLAWVDGGLFVGRLIELRVGAAIVERQQAMPRQGVSSSFTTGAAFGSLLAALQAAQVRTEFVAPSVWKRELGLIKADKRASLDKARLLFPTADLDRQRDHGRAEALLLAWWRLNRKAAA